MSRRLACQTVGSLDWPTFAMRGRNASCNEFSIGAMRPTPEGTYGQSLTTWESATGVADSAVAEVRCAGTRRGCMVVAAHRLRLARAVGRTGVRRVARYSLVGLSGVVVNTAALFVLTDVVHVYYLVSSAIATELAIVSNYLLNNAWSFAELEPQARGLLRFNVVSLVGLLLTVSMLGLLTEVGGLHYLVANVFATGAGAGWNYLASVRWVWARHAAVDAR